MDNRARELVTERPRLVVAGLFMLPVMGLFIAWDGFSARQFFGGFATGLGFFGLVCLWEAWRKLVGRE